MINQNVKLMKYKNQITYNHKITKNKYKYKLTKNLKRIKINNWNNNKNKF